MKRPKENLTTEPQDAKVDYEPRSLRFQDFTLLQKMSYCRRMARWMWLWSRIEGKIKQCCGGRSLCFEVKDKSFYKVQALGRTETLHSRVPTAITGQEIGS